MNIVLTGGTGLVGSSVLAALLADGHAVSALARSDASAATLADAGATPVRGSVEDTGLLAELAAGADGVVHLAAAGDGKDAGRDAALLDALLPVLAGRLYVHTSGSWVHGDGVVDEDSPYAPPQLTAWRVPLDGRVRAAAAAGVRSVVVAPGIVYDQQGGGLVGLLTGGPRTDDGALVLVGPGDQHWTTIDTDDLGRLYARVVAAAEPGSYYLGVGGANPTVRELGEAAAGRVVPSTAAEATDRLGPLAEAFLLDQQATGAKARRELDWTPTARPLLDVLRSAGAAPRAE